MSQRLGNSCINGGSLLRAMTPCTKAYSHKAMPQKQYLSGSLECPLEKFIFLKWQTLPNMPSLCAENVKWPHPFR